MERLFCNSFSTHFSFHGFMDSLTHDFMTTILQVHFLRAFSRFVLRVLKSSVVSSAIRKIVIVQVPVPWLESNCDSNRAERL